MNITTFDTPITNFPKFINRSNKNIILGQMILILSMDDGRLSAGKHPNKTTSTPSINTSVYYEIGLANGVPDKVAWNSIGNKQVVVTIPSTMRSTS